MAPFEALYGRKCKTPLMWSETGKRTLLGPALIKEAEEKVLGTLLGPALIKEAEEKVAEIRARLKEAQSRQKSYADSRRRELSFQAGDSVYLKVSPIRGTHRFKIQGKLAPHYIGPYPIVRRVGKVAYKLQLPESMLDIHDVFHVSQLRKCLSARTAYRATNVPVKILDTVSRKTSISTVRICRVLWSRHGEEEATWEREDALRKEYPDLFKTQPNLEDEIHSKWG
ncbi:hypothetical protein U9M48_030749 [Paspalum notatum var. saurae]|uniref:Tf2-1-like SH3-like domain-containing protein n=1 Tax=Paspalum notatum var. saurae TaxID=547442 RepID=A0AAQ3X3M0_PASNO